MKKKIFCTFGQTCRNLIWNKSHPRKSLLSLTCLPLLEAFAAGVCSAVEETVTSGYVGVNRRSPIIKASTAKLCWITNTEKEEEDTHSMHVQHCKNGGKNLPNALKSIKNKPIVVSASIGSNSASSEI